MNEEALRILNKHIDFSQDGEIDREKMLMAMEEYAKNRYRIGFKDGCALGYNDGYSEATSQAVKEISNIHTPNKQR